MRLLNVNLDTNECLVYIELDSWNWSEKTLEEQLEEIREAAEGLANPRISAEAPYSDESTVIVVQGTRQMTPAERQGIINERDRQRRLRDHMAHFSG